jgi:peptide/nickel transport system ATP-binding protein
VCIARALAAEPDLIICEEITSALDQNIQEGIPTLPIDLQKRLDASYVLITHDNASVRAVADEIVVMNANRIVEQGPTSQVISPPQTFDNTPRRCGR